MSSPGFYIGTTGWSHDSWKGVFYPEKLAKAKYLDHYAGSFATVEMNSIFHQIPPAKALAQIACAVPDSFVFSVRANRYITHIKRLNDGRDIVPNFLAKIGPLGEKIGPILLQMPPNLGFNRERLKSFLAALPRDRRFAFEFHESSWFNEDTYELLAEKNAALGIFQAGERMSPRVSTADFVYVRMHNPKFRKGTKTAGLIENWKDSFQEWSESDKSIFCYFDQAGDDCAAIDALRFRDAIESAVGAGREKGRLMDFSGIVPARRAPGRQPEARAW